MVDESKIGTNWQEDETRTSDSGHGVLGIWLPFRRAGGFETYGGGILVVVEGDAAIPGLSEPQRENATSHPKD